MNSDRPIIYRRLIVAGIAAVAIILLGAYLITTRSSSNLYQAVFLSNGQVYFGKITHRGWKSLSVRDVYYLQVKNIPTSSVATDDLSLIKLGNELHGPEDGLEINWDHVLFIESLRSDSRVVNAIENYHRR